MATNTFFTDSVAHILELLKTNFNEDFKTFYDGDPLLIGQSNVPAITVSKVSSKSMLGPTQYDEVTEVILIKLILNKREDFGAPDTIDMTERKLRFWMEGLDPATGLYLPQSVLGILRTNITVLQSVLEHSEDIQYGVVPRSEKEDFWTQEAHLNFTLRRYIQIPSRV